MNHRGRCPLIYLATFSLLAKTFNVNQNLQNIQIQNHDIIKLILYTFCFKLKSCVMVLTKYNRSLCDKTEEK